MPISIELPASYLWVFGAGVATAAYFGLDNLIRSKKRIKTLMDQLITPGDSTDAEPKTLRQSVDELGKEISAFRQVALDCIADMRQDMNQMQSTISVEISNLASRVTAVERMISDEMKTRVTALEAAVFRSSLQPPPRTPTRKK